MRSSFAFGSPGPLALAALFAGACSGSVEPRGEISLRVSAAFEERSAALGPDAITLRVEGPREAGAVEELAWHAQLIGPGHEAIPFDVTIAPVVGRDSLIAIQPRAPLAPGWHWLGFPKAVRGVWIDGRLSARGIGTLFRTDPYFAPTGVSRCRNEARKSDVLSVQFTMPVSPEARPLVQARLGERACAPLDPARPRTVAFACEVSDWSAPLEISLPDTVVTSHGRPLDVRRDDGLGLADGRIRRRVEHAPASGCEIWESRAATAGGS